MGNDLVRWLATFVADFERVFDDDWDFSRSVLADDAQQFYISPEGTFLSPRVADESNNWANRGALLRSYRELLRAMKEEGISTPA